MKQEELNKILDDHKLWIESKGEKGKQANLKGAYLVGANLMSANLEDANLEGAILEGANLKDVNLTCANLIGANLVEANLTEANLTGAIISHADLEGAKFTIEIRDIWRFQYCEITKDQLPWLALHPDFSRFYSTLKVTE